MNEKRFELVSFNYKNLTGVVYDNLKEEELHLSLYGIIDLLNEVSQQEYNLQKLRDDINRKIDGLIGEW